MRKSKAQTMIEFCFACMVLMVLIYGMVQTVRWVMMDVSERRFDHDASLVQVAGAGDASAQISPNFHHIRFMDTVKH